MNTSKTCGGNLPIIKVYDVDYSFIIKNYLNPEMWAKKWTLFYYKSFVITLNIANIECNSQTVSFKIELTDKDDEKYGETYCIFYANSAFGFVRYELAIDNINILKNKINSQVIEIIMELENKCIRASDQYKEIVKTDREEEERLTEIAEDFLDKERVTNQDIRDAYIDSYVERARRANDFIGKYVKSQRYFWLTDLFLIWAKITNNDELEKTVKETVDDETKINEILQEYKEYEEYTKSDEYEEDMINELEDL